MTIGRRAFLKMGCAAAGLGPLWTRVLSAQQRPARYQERLTELGTLDDGDTLAYVVNDRNLVVGTSGKRGFVWSQESGIRDLGDLGGGSTKGYNINNRNMIVGESMTSTGETHAFLYSSGKMQDLGTLGGDYSIAEEVNESGLVVGASKDKDGVQYACVRYPDRGLEKVPDLGGGQAYGVSVNAMGQVCGFSKTRSGETHAFIYDAIRGITDLGTLGGGYCEGWQINDRGIACGISKTEGGETHGFVWVPNRKNGIEGTMIDIGGFNGQGTYANFVSERGRVLAMTEDEDFPLFGQLRPSDGPIWSPLAHSSISEPSISTLTNPFYTVSELVGAKTGFDSGIRIQAPCAINRQGTLTGWGIRNGVRRAYVLWPER